MLPECEDCAEFDLCDDKYVETEETYPIPCYSWEPDPSRPPVNRSLFEYFPPKIIDIFFDQSEELPVLPSVQVAINISFATGNPDRRYLYMTRYI